jgi:tyrosyl-tRNA synthetase
MGLDGKEKMSKSLGNYIALNDPPEKKFAGLMSIGDETIEHYLHYAARLPRRELEERMRRLREGELSAGELKLEMATIVVGTYHGDAETAAAREAWERGAGG